MEADGNTDNCCLCNQGGSLLCCDGCPASYHLRCIGEQAKSLPEGEWLCPECALGGRGAPLCLTHSQRAINMSAQDVRQAPSIPLILSFSCGWGQPPKSLVPYTPRELSFSFLLLSHGSLCVI